MSNELLDLSGHLLQATHALYLLLDGLDHDGQTVTDGPAAAETFKERLRLYMGAFHYIADGLEVNGKALEELAEGGE